MGRSIGSETYVVLAVGVLMIAHAASGQSLADTISDSAKSLSGSKGDAGKALADIVTTLGKSIADICSSTNYKGPCEKVLGKVKKKDDPNEYVKAAILAGADAVKKAFKLSSDLIVKAEKSKPGIKMALEDCKDLLEDAVDELQAAFSMVGDSKLHTMDQRFAEMQNWLSAVISYQETCRDQFDEDNEFKSAMNNGMLDAGQLTSNALALIDNLADILSGLGLQFGSLFPNSNSRKLLSMDADGYPSWLPTRSRSLLATQTPGGLKPNATVALDGSGQYKTVTEAVAACPQKNQYPFIIYVKAGIYQEYVVVDKKQFNVFMYGDGPTKTIITGSHSNKAGFKTMNSATFAALGAGFVAQSMAFENTAGPEGHQAVALRVQADQSAFLNCNIDGYQDTLYLQTHRQFYNNCTISGTIDFIFGDASAVIQNSLIVVRKPMDNQQNTVTAQGRADNFETTGLVIQNCKIVAEDKLVPFQAKIPSYLGRPWRAYSRTIIMESEIQDVINPEGWFPWEGNLFLDTLYYAEYGNRGAGANTDKRVKWKGFHVLTNKNEVIQYTAGPFLQGQEWLNATHGNFQLGLTQK